MGRNERQPISRRKFLRLGIGAAAGAAFLAACGNEQDGGRPPQSVTDPTTQPEATSTTMKTVELPSTSTIPTTEAPTTTAAPTTTEAPTTTTTEAPLPQEWGSQQSIGEMAVIINGTPLIHTIRTGEKQTNPSDPSAAPYYDVNPTFDIGFGWHNETPFPGRGGAATLGIHHRSEVIDPNHPETRIGLLYVDDIRIRDHTAGVNGEMAIINIAPELGGDTLVYEAVGRLTADTLKPEDQVRGFKQDDPFVQLRVYTCDDNTRYRTVVEYQLIQRNGVSVAPFGA